MDNDPGSDVAPQGRAPSDEGRDPNLVIALAALALALPLTIVAVALCAAVPGLPWWLGLAIGPALAAGLVAYRLRGAYTKVLGRLQASPADRPTHPRFHNIVQGLALAGGVGEPDLYVVDDPGRNAAALGRGDRSAIVASAGLLEALDRIALEAIVAECLVRIRNGDAAAATVGAVLFSPLLSGPARPLGRHGLGRLLAEDRDLLADRAAVALTRYPPGLTAAFTAIGMGTPRLTRISNQLDHLWLVPPAALDGPGPVAVETPPLTLRIDVLGEL